VSLTLHLVYRTGRGGLARNEHAHRGDRGPAGSWTAAGHPAPRRRGAEPDPVPTGRDQTTWACRSGVMVWASRRVSSPLVLTPPDFIQIADYEREVKLQGCDGRARRSIRYGASPASRSVLVAGEKAGPYGYSRHRSTRRQLLAIQNLRVALGCVNDLGQFLG
jgi:hypothetical protein